MTTAITLTDNDARTLPKFGIKPPPRLLRPERRDNELTMKHASALMRSGRFTTRDFKIIQTIWMMGVATSEQVRRLMFSDLKSGERIANRRLKFLYDEYCLDRIWFSINEPPIYILDIMGARIIQLARKAKNTREIHWSATRQGQYTLFLDHSLEITEFAVRLAEATRAEKGELRWIGETILTLTRADGGRFEPDGIGILDVWDTKLPFFLEWQRQKRDIADKIQHYLNYRNEDGWKGKFPYFPPLLFVTTAGDDWLKRHFKTVEQEMGRYKVTAEKFAVWMTTQERLDRDGILGPIWYQPGKTPSQDLAWDKEGFSLPEAMMGIG